MFFFLGGSFSSQERDGRTTTSNKQAEDKPLKQCSNEKGEKEREEKEETRRKTTSSSVSISVSSHISLSSKIFGKSVCVSKPTIKTLFVIT